MSLCVHLDSTVLYLMFAAVLGATVERKVLLTDYMITEKVSALGKVLWCGGGVGAAPCVVLCCVALRCVVLLYCAVLCYPAY